MLPMNSSASSVLPRRELEERDLVAQVVVQVARVDGDRLEVLLLLVLLAAPARVEAVEQDLLPVDLVLAAFSSSLLRLGLLAVSSSAPRRPRPRPPRLHQVEERVVQELLLQVLLEVEQRHVQQIHRLIEAWIDLELLPELRALVRVPALMSASCARARPLGESRAQARGQRRAEVDLGHRVVEDELPHRSGDLHLPVEHDVGAVHDVERLLDVVVADQHADPAVAQAGHDLLNVVDRNRIDARERLVQHHELRLA